MEDLPAELLRPTNNTGQFEPKLTDAERCAVLAAYHAGVKAEALALAYGLNRRTVGHITNPYSKHYRATRKEMDKLGREAFIGQYFTADVRKKLIGVAKRPELATKRAQANANRKAGIHVVKPDQCAYSHRLEVRYFDDREPRGWYVRDLDSKTDPELYYHNGQDSLASSQNALALAEANLTDD